MARITLITRVGCHLCDEARETVQAVADDLGCGLAEIDIDSDGSLPRRYSELVPVILVDGAVHDTWRVDERRLRAALAAPSPGSSSAEGQHGTARWWHRFTRGQ